MCVKEIGLHEAILMFIYTLNVKKTPTFPTAKSSHTHFLHMLEGTETEQLFS